VALLVLLLIFGAIALRLGRGERRARPEARYARKLVARNWKASQL
jgi:hypothetical protein